MSPGERRDAGYHWTPVLYLLQGNNARLSRLMRLKIRWRQGAPDELCPSRALDTDVWRRDQAIQTRSHEHGRHKHGAVAVRPPGQPSLSRGRAAINHVVICLEAWQVECKRNTYANAHARARMLETLERAFTQARRQLSAQ